METKESFRILLVDDVPVNIDILASAFAGYRIQMAKDGKKALSLLSSPIKPDIILLDVDMPGMNGYEVCSEIRRRRDCDGIPVIFLTAKTDKDSIIKGFSVGGQDYVTKPFDFSELVARVTTHLELKRSKEKLHELNDLLEKKVEERTRDLRSTLAKLEDTNKELDTFVYRASHDLKGPTASLLGLVYIGKQFPTGEKDEILDRIETTIVNLNKVLDKLILKHVISQMPVTQEPLKVDELINEIIAASGGSINKANILLPTYESPTIYADRQLLRIILSNLVENALVFSPDDRVEIKIDVIQRDDHILISVEDNGDGIEEGVEEKIFDLFYRGSIKSRGNGLGLYLASKSVEKLNGTIKLETDRKTYTRFTIELPMPSESNK